MGGGEAKSSRGGDPPRGSGGGSPGQKPLCKIQKEWCLLQGWNSVGVQRRALIPLLSNRHRARAKRDAEGRPEPRDPSWTPTSTAARGRAASPFRPPRSSGPATCGPTTPPLKLLLASLPQQPSMAPHCLRDAVGLGTALPSGVRLSRFIPSLVPPRSSPPRWATHKDRVAARSLPVLWCLPFHVHPLEPVFQVSEQRPPAPLLWSLKPLARA